MSGNILHDLKLMVTRWLPLAVMKTRCTGSTESKAASPYFTAHEEINYIKFLMQYVQLDCIFNAT
jgi:hypothetical protein